MRREFAELCERNALSSEEAFHPIRVPAAVTSCEEEFAMYLSPILFNGCRYIHDTPHLLLTAFGADKHCHKLGRIESIRFRTPTPPIDFDARRVDDAIRDTAAHQVPMQPESVAAGFVTAAHRRTRRQVEVCLRSRDRDVERLECARRHLVAERRLIHSGCHRQDPFGVAELEGEI
jgi:hypothetical protein